MAGSLRARLLAVLVLIMSLGLGVPAFAQGPDKQMAAKVLRLVKDANDEFDRGEFDDALRLYQQAYDLYPDAVLLYRIGLSADKAEQPRRAIEAYEAFVAAAKSDDATAQKVTERVAEIRGTLAPRLTVTSVPAGADVFLANLDNAPLGQTPGEFEITAGGVDVLVRLNGHRLHRQTVTLANGEDTVVDVQLEKLEGLADPDPRPPQSDGGGMSLGTWGWITTGVGLAVIGTGTAFAFMASSATDDVNGYDKRAPGATRAELEEIKGRANRLHSTSVGFFVGGGVVTAVGVSLILIDALSGDEESARLVPALGATREGAWVGLTGRF